MMNQGNIITNVTFYDTDKHSLPASEKIHNSLSTPNTQNMVLPVTLLLHKHTLHCTRPLNCVCDCRHTCHWHVLKSGTLPWHELRHGFGRHQIKHCANSLGICRSQIWKRHRVIVRHHETDWKGQSVFNQQHRLTLIWQRVKWLKVSHVAVARIHSRRKDYCNLRWRVVLNPILVTPRLKLENHIESFN